MMNLDDYNDRARAAIDLLKSIGFRLRRAWHGWEDERLEASGHCGNIGVAVKRDPTTGTLKVFLQSHKPTGRGTTIEEALRDYSASVRAMADQADALLTKLEARND